MTMARRCFLTLVLFSAENGKLQNYMAIQRWTPKSRGHPNLGHQPDSPSLAAGPIPKETVIGWAFLAQ